MGVDVAIPLFEETVEWAGAINSVLMDKPRLFGQAMLLMAFMAAGYWDLTAIVDGGDGGCCSPDSVAPSASLSGVA